MPLIEYITYKNISIYLKLQKKNLLTPTNLNMIVTFGCTTSIALFLARFWKVQVVMRLTPREKPVCERARQWLRPLPEG